MDIPGICGEIQRQMPVSMNYPCFILNSSIELAESRTRIITKLLLDAPDDNTINIYLSDETELHYLGSIYPEGLAALLDLIGSDNFDNIQGYLSEDKPLDSKYFLALS